MNQQTAFRSFVDVRSLLARLFVPCCFCLPAGALHAQVTFDWAIVGDPGNPPDQLYTDGNPDNLRFGAVGYKYRISKYEVTNDQYTAFLNAVDTMGMNPNDLYSNEMG